MLPVGLDLWRHAIDEARLQLGLARQRLGLGHVGHLHLVMQPALLVVERGGHGEDRLAVLDGDHPAGREAAAVADAVDLVDDGDCGIAGAQEIGMERMGQPPLDGTARRDQRLADHLPAEYALPADLRAQAPVEVLLERLEIED